jgi:spoIIIJ-associated protein
MENGSLTFSAPSVEEAVERGLALLGLTRRQVSVEIVDQGSRGILGIGARDAVVRLQPLPVKEPEEIGEIAVSVEEEEEEEEEGAEEELEEYVLSEEQVAEVARQTLSELLDKMDIPCQVVIRQDKDAQGRENPITLDVLGDDLSILIGRQGEVLNALQYITRLIVSREVERWVNLVVDVEGYKQRRANSLQQLARRIAERVARTRQPVALEPMPPHERRVIHITLRDHPTVTTQSVGRGDRRKVTIIPKR